MKTFQQQFILAVQSKVEHKPVLGSKVLVKMGKSNSFEGLIIKINNLNLSKFTYQIKLCNGLFDGKIAISLDEIIKIIQ